MIHETGLDTVTKDDITCNDYNRNIHRFICCGRCAWKIDRSLFWTTSVWIGNLNDRVDHYRI